MAGRLTAAALTAALGLAAAGCGGDDGGGSGRLSDALDSVSAGPATERSFAWSDIAAIRELADLPDDPTQDMDALRHWQTPLGTGASLIAPGAISLRDAVGLDLYGADQAITIGQDDQGNAIRMDGVDGAAVADGVRKAGATASRAGEHEVLDFGPVDLGSDDPAVFLPFMRLPLVLAEDETVVLASDARALEDALGEGQDPLVDQAAYAAAADCLGDVVSATISPASGIGVSSVRYVATGVRGGDDPVELLCAIGDEGQADAAAQTLRDALAPGARDMVTGQTMDELIAGADVETGGDGDAQWARATITPLADQPLGFVMEALRRSSVATWLGGEPRG